MKQMYFRHSAYLFIFCMNGTQILISGYMILDTNWLIKLDDTILFLLIQISLL